MLIVIDAEGFAVGVAPEMDIHEYAAKIGGQVIDDAGYVAPPPPPDVWPLIESSWRATELSVIAKQLDALEEAEYGEPPVDLLPGTRPQWLGYRGLIRNWQDGADGYPNADRRPTRPT
ncbi:hypothetical protein [Pseudomonas mosselii]|uniref:Phage tail protein n=1 Tax=Pseudomonas mosselii TaxID=78327 RepID=A0A7W2K0Y3_9PSED|nr:hypothetical protein [Pseudomonas mosselii]MBA6068593.1 hypothetical protein [Pseudomonas mosselii]